MFNGKIHYFYGHFPLLFVCSPEGKASYFKFPSEPIHSIGLDKSGVKSIPGMALWQCSGTSLLHCCSSRGDLTAFYCRLFEPFVLKTLSGKALSYGWRRILWSFLIFSECVAWQDSYHTKTRYASMIVYVSLCKRVSVHILSMYGVCNISYAYTIFLGNKQMDTIHLLTPGATFLIDGNVGSKGWKKQHRSRRAAASPQAIGVKAQLCGRSTPVCPETHQPQQSSVTSVTSVTQTKCCRT